MAEVGMAARARTVDPSASREPVYLDYQATTPVDPAVLEVMLPFFTHEFGNASSRDHGFGARAEAAVEEARGSVATLIGARGTEIVFTSGSTEANNLALFGIMDAYADRGDHLITTATEHKAILDTARHLESQGKRVSILPVDHYGRVDPEQVRAAIDNRTVLVSVMAANNEVGTLAPLAEIGRITREAGVLLHTDATQAVGYVPIDVEAMRIDLLSLSAHKFYGPKGVGALYVRRRNPRVRPSPILRGGGHERGLRSGTLNVPGIAGLGKAAAIAQRSLPETARHLVAVRDQFIAGVTGELDDVHLNGHPVDRLPHNASLYIGGVDAKSLVLTLPDLAFSTGAACATEKVEPSHVIEALGLGHERAHGTIRVSFGRSTTMDDADYAAQRLVETVNRLRRVRSAFA